ncbi:MAG: hypothetical protein LBK41_04680 [Clostridiales bacterium]|nr:hypothetical protein [Clostridiales bacterium]
MKKLTRLALVFAALAVACVNINMIAVEIGRRWVPAYDRSDVAPILRRKALSPADYHELFIQTGMGKPLIDSLSPDELERFALSSQDAFFGGADVICEQVGIITREERLADGGAGRPMAPLLPGDVLVTFSTHSAGWRHGHSGIITEPNRLLEAYMVGRPAGYSYASDWLRYSTLIVLRPKDGVSGRAAAYHAQDLEGVNYALLTGIWPIKSPEGGVTGTQCAHLIWYPYYLAGVDADPGGDWLIEPRDLVTGGAFDVVCAYGVDPEWLLDVTGADY